MGKSAKILDSGDASTDSLRLAVAMGLRGYEETKLLDLLTDPSPIVRTSAAQELHIRGGKRVFDRAVKLSKDESFVARGMAAFLIGQLGTPKCPFASRSFPVLKRLLSDPDENVRDIALNSIGFLGANGHITPPAVARRVFELASDSNPLMRASATWTLWCMRQPKALARLRELTRDENAMVRREARYWLEP